MNIDEQENEKLHITKTKRNSNDKFGKLHNPLNKITPCW